jgi:hypothetical protein
MSLWCTRRNPALAKRDNKLDNLRIELNNTRALDERGPALISTQPYAFMLSWS